MNAYLTSVESGLRHHRDILAAALLPCAPGSGDSVDLNTCWMGRVREWAQEMADHGATFVTLARGLEANPPTATSTDPEVRSIQMRIVVGESGMARAMAIVGATLDERANFWRGLATDVSNLAVQYRRTAKGWGELADNPEYQDRAGAAVKRDADMAEAQRLVDAGLQLADMALLDLGYARKLRSFATQFINDRLKERSLYLSSLGAALAGWRGTLQAWQADNKGGFVGFLGRIGAGIIGAPGALAKSLGKGFGEGLAALGAGAGKGAKGLLGPIVMWGLLAAGGLVALNEVVSDGTPLHRKLSR